MQEKSLMAWFSKRHASTALKKGVEHAGKLVSASIELQEALKYGSNGLREEAKKALNALFAFEKDADNIEVQIADELSVAELEPRMREFLLRMIRHEDYAVDWLKEAGMNLELFLELNLSCNEENWRDLIKMAEKIVECTKALRNSLEMLCENANAAKESEKAVEILEHEIDEIYFKAKKNVLLLTENPKTLMLLREILHAMENAADNCKDTGDMIKMLVIAGL